MSNQIVVVHVTASGSSVLAMARAENVGAAETGRDTVMTAVVGKDVRMVVRGLASGAEIATVTVQEIAVRAMTADSAAASAAVRTSQDRYLRKAKERTQPSGF